MFQVISKRWIRDSDDENNNLEFVVWSGTRIKEARGQIKANVNSLRDNMETHGWSNGQRIDNGLVQYWDDQGVWFEQTFRIREIE